MHEAPHTAHRLVAIGRSPSTDLFAISNISGEMIGSAMDFFFILVFTIEQIRLRAETNFQAWDEMIESLLRRCDTSSCVSYLSDVPCPHRASKIRLSYPYCYSLGTGVNRI